VKRRVRRKATTVKRQGPWASTIAEEWARCALSMHRAVDQQKLREDYVEATSRAAATRRPPE